MTTDAPAVVAAIAARKKTLDRQSAAAAVGMVVVAAIFTIDGADRDRTVQGLITVLPWLVGLSIAIFLMNRWTLSIQSRSIRRQFSEIGNLPAGPSPASPQRDRPRKYRN